MMALCHSDLVKPTRSNMKDLTLIACGTEVTTKLGEIEGMVTCQSIRFERVIYEITYFDAKTSKTLWMHENEFILGKKAKKVKVGFGKAGDDKETK